MDIREDEITILAPELNGDNNVNPRQLLHLSATCTSMIKEDWYMMADLLSATQIESMFSNLYLSRFADVVIQSIRNHSTRDVLHSFCQFYDISYRFQETIKSFVSTNVHNMGDDSDGKARDLSPVKSIREIPQGKRRQQTNLNRPSTPVRGFAPPQLIRRSSDTLLSLPPRPLVRRANTLYNIDHVQPFNDQSLSCSDFINKAFATFSNEKMVKGNILRPFLFNYFLDYLEQLFNHVVADEPCYKDNVYILSHYEHVFSELGKLVVYMRKPGFSGKSYQ
jgi:hypothetical protein